MGAYYSIAIRGTLRKLGIQASRVESLGLCNTDPVVS